MTNLWNDESGQDVAEYAVMLMVILAIVIGVVMYIGHNAGSTINSAASQISGANQ
jgi:Flp pilus assembly pilin Flp